VAVRCAVAVAHGASLALVTEGRPPTGTYGNSVARCYQGLVSR
jgi:hypothetical protein